MLRRNTARSVSRGLRIGLTALVAAALMLVGVTPAMAAGPAQVSVEITPIDPATGQTITATGWNQHNNRLAYRIGYSCSVAECTNAVITLPAAALDPTYGQFRLLQYETWTPPAGGGATIANNVATGVTVNLGNVAPGTSSTFVVQYQRAIDTSAPGIVPGAYFPDGYQIQRSATISSPNATGDVTASAAPVTWQQTVPTPSIVKSVLATVRPDTDVTYTIGMSDGCMSNLGSGRWIGNGRYTCAESYTVVDTLPTQAVFVSASNGGVYDAATRTVTWTGSGPTAAGGWGVAATGGWSQGYAHTNRTVTVRYPASVFPEGAGGADFIAPVTNDVAVSVTYLDDAATTKTATGAATHNVVRAAPFGRSTQSKISSGDAIVGGQRQINVPPDVTGLTCPSGGRDDWNRVCTPGQPLAAFTTRTDQYWTIDTTNGGNVPGVATVVDNNLADGPVRVHTISTNSAATIAWTITDGTTSTSGTTTGTNYVAPTGSWLTSATVTSGSLVGPNLLPSGTATTTFRVLYRFNVAVGSSLATWNNTATGTMTYPDNPEVAPISVNSSGSVTFREWPKVAAAPPAISAGITNAVVEGGGTVVPGGNVTFTVSGTTATIPSDKPLSPQYVFIAPVGWTINSGSAAFATGTVPPGVAYTYKTVTVGGVQRAAVIASWPSGATFGSNATLPSMTVVASPTFAVASGTSSIATAWIGDSLNQFGPDTTTWGGKVVDTTDVDGDGNTTEAFASGTRAVSVSGTDRLDVIKEICVDNGAGCTWVSNPDIVVGVAPDASDITYRVTFRNSGNTVLSGVVGYDVLPWIGDDRDSTFSEIVNSIGNSSGNLTLQYSTSTNPCRAEVLPTNPGCVTGWTTTAAGAQAIRATVSGSLAPGATSAFVFSANVVPGAPADAVACNSVTADSASTLPSGPRPVCATTQQADLTIAVPDRLPLQAGRPGTVPFTITNLGGSQAAPASVQIDVPAGIRITSLTPAGWACEASTQQPDGSALGPVTLDCDAVDATGAARALVLNVPDALDLPAVIPDEALVGEDTCFPATVSGLMSDPDLTNNDASACFAVAAGDALLGLTKDDGLTETTMGATLTYTVEVSNLLVGESAGPITVTDTLPDHVTFVSASDGGVVSDQGEPDGAGILPGGVVTWTIDSLDPSGTASGAGDSEAGAVGSTRSLTVTVRVLQTAEAVEEIVNAASATTADPASPDQQLTAADEDADEIVRTAAIALVKTADVATYDAVDATISYEFVVTNSGNVTLTDVSVSETAFTGAGTLDEVECPSTSLAPAQSVTCTATYVVEQGDLDAGSVSNTATATGTPPAGLSAPTSDPSTVEVDAVQATSLTIAKTASPTTGSAAGDEITYTFLVTNTGNVTVTDADIVEGDFDGDADLLSEIVCADEAESLAPSDSVECEATYELTQADLDRGSVSNTATATADAPGALADPVSPPSTAVVTIAADATLELEKSLSGATAEEAGDTLTYLFAVTNTGNVTVSGIAIDETDFTGSGLPVSIECPSTELAPEGEVTCVGTYVLTQADVDAGGVENTAVATGTAPGGASVESESSSAELVIGAEPELTLVKSASPGTLVVDQVVTYSFVVTNSGNVTVTDIAIDETEFTGTGTMSSIACAATELAPDAQTVCSATYTITQADVDAAELGNTAIATGVSPAGPLGSTESSVSLPFDQSPALSIVKSADVEGYAELGDAIGYTFRVTNTGNVTMSGIDVAEDEFSGTGDLSEIVCAASPLLPGQFVDCTATYVVTQADLDAGELENTAHAVATAPQATEPSASGPSTVTLPFVGESGLRLEKTGTPVDADSNGIITAGDKIVWGFTVTNLGVTTLTEVVVDDPTAGEVVCEATILPPGASVECVTATYTITPSDATAGTVVNVASASALGAAGAVVGSAEARAAVAVVPMPLAFTGLPLGMPIVAALLLLLAGGAAVWIARSRRRTAA